MSANSDVLEKATVLVVDDTPDNLTLMSGLLKDEFKVKVANSGERALKVAGGDPPPDIVLLDIMMPGMDGYEVLRRMKADDHTRDIPIIFLTAMTAVEDEQKGLELGAVDYLTKPVSPPITLARIRNHLYLKKMQDFLKSQNTFLEDEVASRTQEVRAIQDVTILAMASLAETRDNETGGHIRRTQLYMRALARQLSHHPTFAWFLTEENIELLFKSAPLHDIGKVGVPDSVLLKAGPLTPEEREIMETHTVLGRDSIQEAESRLGMKVPFLSLAKEIAYAHQEKWDGSGYPEGIAGEDIAVGARLMALADVYDALISKRVYKPPLTHDEAKAIIVEGRGKHFDPDVVDAFLAIEEEFKGIAAEFSE
jgi:putative two-component system response regulator